MILLSFEEKADWVDVKPMPGTNTYQLFEFLLFSNYFFIQVLPLMKDLITFVLRDMANLASGNVNISKSAIYLFFSLYYVWAFSPS